MRDDREYQPDPAPGTVRIAAFGDSFTYGADVELHESWGKRLASFSAKLDVLNYGVNAYGLDQAYLRYRREARRYHPHIVFIGYMSENIARNVNVWRPFYTRAPTANILTKPRFQIRGGELVLLPNPLPTRIDYEKFLKNETRVLARLGKNDFHYGNGPTAGAVDFSPTVRLAKLLRANLKPPASRPIFRRDGMYDVGSEAYEVTAGIFDAFYMHVLENGALPVIVVFPNAGDQDRNRNGKPRRYGPLFERFRSKEYRHMDLMSAIEKHEAQYAISDLTQEWGHFSAIGNEIVAKYMLAWLDAGGYLDPARVRDAVERERRRFGMTAKR